MTLSTAHTWLCEADDGVDISIYVQPGARVTELAGEHDGALKLRIHAPPVDGKANAAVIAYLASKLAVPKSRIAMISGDKNRRKRLHVAGVSTTFALEKLSTTLV